MRKMREQDLMRLKILGMFLILVHRYQEEGTLLINALVFLGRYFVFCLSLGRVGVIKTGLSCSFSGEQILHHASFLLSFSTLFLRSS